jgi:hypothetical protein
VPYPILAIAAAILLIACCGVLVGIGILTVGTESVTAFVADLLPTGTEAPTATAIIIVPKPSAVVAVTPTPRAAPTHTPAPTDTPTVTPVVTDTPPRPPTEQGPTPTPIIIVVTATPTPEPPPTERPAQVNTPAAAASVEASATLTSTYKYPAPVLVEPANNSKIGGSMAILKWQPVSLVPLDADEWYAIRLIYLQQGKPVYQGDDIKEIEWRIPERFYYQADGPALLYRWFVFVEKKGADGTATQVSPNSEEFVFRWE